MAVNPLYLGLEGFVFPTPGGFAPVPVYTTPALTPARLSATSLSVAVAGDPAATYQVTAVGPRLSGSVVLGTAPGGGSVVAAGLTYGGDYLLWAAALAPGGGGSFASGVGFAAVSLADLDSVLAAFRRTMAGSPATQAALPGGLWANEVPEDAEMPFGYLELLESRFQWTTEDFHVELARVRLHVYASGAENCERTVRAVRNLYDWQDLEFAGGDSAANTVQVMPTDASVQGEFQRLRDGSVVYQATVEYECSVNRGPLRS